MHGMEVGGGYSELDLILAEGKLYSLWIVGIEPLGNPPQLPQLSTTKGYDVPLLSQGSDVVAA